MTSGVEIGEQKSQLTSCTPVVTKFFSKHELSVSNAPHRLGAEETRCAVALLVQTLQALLVQAEKGKRRHSPQSPPGSNVWKWSGVINLVKKLHSRLATAFGPSI